MFYRPPKAHGSQSEKHCFRDKQARHRRPLLSALLSGSCCSTLCHFVFSAFTLPTKGHQLFPLWTRCSALLSSCCPVLVITVHSVIPLDPCCAPCTPPRSAPPQSTIAQGMQNNASLFCILKKTVRVLLEGMSCLHCYSVIVSSFSCQESWPQCSSLHDPHSSLQILQADTLAPPVAFRLCQCWPAGTESFHLLSPCFINCHIGGFDLPWNQVLPKDLLHCSAPLHIIARESCAVGND